MSPESGSGPDQNRPEAPVTDRISAANENTPLLEGQQQQLPKPTDDATGEVTVLVEDISDARLLFTLSVTWVGVFLGAIDATIIATLLVPISNEFGSLSSLSWLATAYLIATATCQPLSGRLTDIFGRGPGLVFSNVMFAVGNLICGLAKDEYTIIFGRVIAGVGGGGLMSISTFLGSDLVPLRKRGLFQGIGNVVYGSGAMLGGVLGGLLNDASAWGWRLAFLIQVPIVLASAILVHVLVKVPPKVSNKSLISRIDWTGSFLTVTCLVTLLLGLNAGGNMVPWTHPSIVVSLLLSLMLLVAFVWWESRAQQPIIPVRLLLGRTVFTACITNFVAAMNIITATFYVPLYLQVLGHTPTQAGLRLLASPLGVSFSSIGAGIVMKRTGKYVGLGIASQAIMLLGVVALNLLDEKSPSWLPFVSMILHGAGYGAMLTTTLLACIAAVDHSQQAVITAATYLFRSVGTTVGMTISSAVYQNILKARLWERFGHLPGAAEEISRIRNDLGELQRLPKGWHDGVILSFMEAFRGVWWTSLGLAIVGLISIALMKQHKLHSTLARGEE
ncbi:major facilitator superfamily domain-containing protein [Immersiella caudata]|uniref:Major facilitator superfamily domain-containing protein n=1 Tax=Immersiella caudata TaxID=314043 RepID=A0AA40C785_9PEZI|nr:major facilitator superfamily domain-containing protein [Immersiella caudata]